MTRRASLPGAAELFRTTAGSASPADSGPLAPNAAPARASVPVGRRASGPREPSGRERHDEKITVYCSAQELLDLESARLRLRAEHGVAVDRGRVVREAISLVLADLEENGAASALLRRLQQP